MDNTSHRHSNEDTATSMYLSFDAESTISTACYRTLEAMSDISALSGNELDVSVDRNETDGVRGTNISTLKTVKKMGIPESLPLRTLPKNILKEYKVLCSTPSKDQLLKTVDVTRGSDATRCLDLGLAFLGVDDDKPAYFPSPPVHLREENKENEEATLSTCSSVKITSVIEKKMLHNAVSLTEEDTLEEAKITKDIKKDNTSVEITTSVIEKKMLHSAVSLTEKDTLDEEKIIKDIKKDNTSVDVIDKYTNVYSLVCGANSDQQFENENSTVIKEENTKIIKAIVEDVDNVDIIKGSLEAQDEKTPELEIAKENVNKKPKPKIAALIRNVRHSVCEPNLQTNIPSRIFNSDNKRRSLLPTSKKSASNFDAEIEIPLLMSKILKITNTTVDTKECDILKEKAVLNNHKNASPADKRRYIMPTMKTRASLIPSTQGSKRPFSFTHRMSVVVKTTLNSPARKITRKSTMSGTFSSLQRKSVMPQKFTTTDKSNVNSERLPPKTIGSKSHGINNSTQTNYKNVDVLHKRSTTTTSPQRKSIHHSEKVLEKSRSKRDISYTCSVCKEKFRLKSLLDAHKRSHESDDIAPAFIKKPTTITHNQAVLGNSNQCKYCDKKFALLKALHIHLLQNCLKIPPSEKRKLEYTDLNHVEKAQLPNVFSHHNMQSSASSTVSSTCNTPRYPLKQNNVMTMPKSSTESLTESKDMQKMTSNFAKNINGNNSTTSHTTVQKNKKFTAHTGVYKTPSKSVPCHLCKLTFKSILDYTNHNLTTHGTHKAYDASETLGE